MLSNFKLEFVELINIRFVAVNVRSRSNTERPTRCGADLDCRWSAVDFHANLTHHFHRILTHPCS
jgi:hypothetical protein